MQFNKASGQMTDIQFLRKSKAESCRPCTSNACDVVWRTEGDCDDEQVYSNKRVVELAVTMMQLDKTSGRMTDIPFLRKSGPESCMPCTSHDFEQARMAKDEWGACFEYTLLERHGNG
jgi:hypothetical protein